MTRLLIVGPPGAGKGTQATKIAARYGIPAISTGDIFRDNIKRETALGVEVKKIVDAGDYVPDALTNQLVADRITQTDAAEGFLLDGYPRTLGQVDFLRDELASKNESLDAVVRLVVDEDEVVSRLVKRAETSGRSDDTEETIRYRLQVFNEQTAPLVRVYENDGLLVDVDGMGSVDDVFTRIEQALAARGIVAK